MVASKACVVAMVAQVPAAEGCSLCVRQSIYFQPHTQNVHFLYKKPEK